MIDDSEGRLPNLSALPRDCIMSTLIVKRGNDRTRDYDVLVDPPPHGYEPTREAAMAAFAKSWRRE
jgi:hypothetical protein